MKYEQLTLFERERIIALVQMGKSHREIGRLLYRNHTTISREIKRNSHAVTDMIGYVAPCAHKAYKERKRISGQRLRLKNTVIRNFVEEHLKNGWSPEQIAGLLRRQKYQISHEAIYQYVYSEHRDLIELLARRHKQRYHKNAFRKRQKSHIPNRIAIDVRGKIIDNRREYGHWESDSIVSSKSAISLNVLVERKSRLVRLQLLPDKKAYSTATGILRSLENMPYKLRKSITYDNGFENINHEKINYKLGTKSYFCKPYHSWEKGTVENTNGLIRRFIPKNMDLKLVSCNDLLIIENLLNNRPRKCLGFYTPQEVFNRQLNRRSADEQSALPTKSAEASESAKDDLTNFYSSGALPY